MPFVSTSAPKLSRDVAAARRNFQAGGWSYRSAAPLLGISYQHLCQVLRGNRHSRRLVTAILSLPPRRKS